MTNTSYFPLTIADFEVINCNKVKKGKVVPVLNQLKAYGGVNI
jgi:hypothetical protein